MDQGTQKGITKELSTLLSWGKEQIIGYKSEKKDFRKIVTKILCKDCAKHKDEILNDPTLNDIVATAAKALISGTSSATKDQVEFFSISCCENQKQPHRTFLTVNKLEADSQGIP